MKKTASIIIVIGLIIALAIVFVGSTGPDSGGGIAEGENIEIKDGTQFITINAKGGYSPRITEAEAGIPSKLVVKTDGTFDCSLSLVIRSLGFQKILAQTGEELIDIGTPKAGESIQGLCSMGMYSFRVNFI